jgi:hypothetical protein
VGGCQANRKRREFVGTPIGSCVKKGIVSNVLSYKILKIVLRHDESSPVEVAFFEAPDDDETR